MPNLGDQLLHFLIAYQQGKDEILREVFFGYRMVNWMSLSFSNYAAQKF